MEKISSPLQLDEFFIIKLNAKYVEGKFEKTHNKFNIYFDYQVGINKKNNNLFSLKFIFKIKPEKGKSGIKIDAELDGYFSFPPDTDNDDMQYLIRVNGCSILYSLLRGQISMITGSFPEGKFNLPTIVFQDEIMKIEKRKEKKKIDT